MTTLEAETVKSEAKTMLAARAHEGAADLRLEEVPRPTPGAGEVVIAVASAGVASGLLSLWQKGLYPILPRTLGNTASGTIAEVGPGVSSFKVGDRVRVHAPLSCRRCRYCLADQEQFCRQASVLGHGIFGPDAMDLHRRYLDGALAEQLLVPEWAVDPLPEEVSFDAAAKIHDVSDGLRALRIAELPPGATIVVTAATGVLGCAIVRLAPKFGVARIVAVGRSRARLEQTRALAPDLVDTLALEDLPDGWQEASQLTAALRELVPEGPDALFDFFEEGQATWQAIRSLRHRGTAVLMAPNSEPMPVSSLAMLANGWRIIGTRGCTRRDTHDVTHWLQEGSLRIDDLITHRFPLSQIAEATLAVRERTEPTWMVVVHPGER